MKKILWSFLHLFISCDNCAIRSSETKLINGSLAELDQYPAVVKIESPPLSCTGVFIGHDLLLTSYHCIASHLKVSVIKNDTIVHSINVFKNPLFDSSDVGHPYAKDLALVRFPAKTSKIFMSLATIPAKPNDKATSVGFGRNDCAYVDFNCLNLTHQTYNKQVGTLILGQGITERMFGPEVQLVAALHTNHITFLGDQTGLAEGDSGGPLLNSKNEIIGIASAYDSEDHDEETIVFSKWASIATPVGNHFFKLAHDAGFYP